MKTKRTVEDYVISIVAYSFMTIFALFTLIPFLNVVAKAFSSDWAVLSGQVGIIPKSFNLDSMGYVLSEEAFWRALGISVLSTVIGTACSMVITAITAYPLSKKHLPCMKIILFLFIFTMLFSGGMVPEYLNMGRLGLINTFPVLILPGLLSVYNMLIIKNYYESLPESIEESARIDGASNIGILFRIVAPLSVPVYATIILFIVVTYWNSYMTPMMFTTKSTLKTLQLYIRDLILEASSANTVDSASAANFDNISSEGVRSATIVVSVIPMLAIYPFIQKYFLKGILIGSVKG